MHLALFILGIVLVLAGVFALKRSRRHIQALPPRQPNPIPALGEDPERSPRFPPNINRLQVGGTVSLIIGLVLMCETMRPVSALFHSTL